MPGLIRQSRDGILLTVRATPKSSKDAITGVIVRGALTQLGVKIRAAPHDGEANHAVVKLIAASFGCRPTLVSIAAGYKDRDKTVLISGADLDGVQAWLDRLEQHGETD